MFIRAITRAKLQSNHDHQQTNIQFYYKLDVLPVVEPTVKALSVTHGQCDARPAVTLPGTVHLSEGSFVRNLGIGLGSNLGIWTTHFEQMTLRTSDLKPSS